MKKRERIQPYLQRLYGYAVSLTHDPHQAEDLVQECAVRAIAAGSTPRDEHAYRAWLFRILRNLYFDRVRHEKVVESAAAEEFFAGQTEFWQGEERLITVLTVRLELGKLPREKREIITLIDIVGLSYAEAADLLDIPVGTVMSRISRARRMLLDAIGTSNVHELPVNRKKRSR